MAEKKVKKDDELIINDSTKQESDQPDTQPHTELEGKSLNEEPETPSGESALDQPTPKKHRWSRKKIALVVSAALIVLIAVLALIPATRYGIAGLVVKRDVTFTLRDSKTNKPVSHVAIEVAGQIAITDAKGSASFKSLPVGIKTFDIQKKNYKNFNTTQTVPIFGSNPTFDFAIEATGRQVPVKIINKISQKPVEGADITADGTSSKTDKNGEAVLVLPADKDTVDASVTNPGYNLAKTTITVTEQKDDKNTFTITPAGKLYFLSKRSGTIDVLKSDLDGGNVETVLKGTGKEEDRDTVMLASRDWKYLALLSRRDSDKPKVYVIETATGKLSTVDEGDANFELKGWSNQHLVYTVGRSNLKPWQSKGAALKSYNATSSQLNTLDETAAVGNESGYANQWFNSVYILNNLLVYTKNWAGYTNVVAGQHPEALSVRPDGQNRQTIKNFGDGYELTAKAYEPQEIYFRASKWAGGVSASEFYEYEDGQIKKVTATEEQFAQFYPTYLISPSGSNTFWYEPRDGKNTLFVGDKDGANEKQIASLSEYTPYGWYGEDYLLVSKGGSELYVISRQNPSAAPLKVTDYHKPRIDFAGYGYGYGGF